MRASSTVSSYMPREPMELLGVIIRRAVDPRRLSRAWGPRGGSFTQRPVTAPPIGVLAAMCVIGITCGAIRSARAVELPQEHGWQLVLRSYLATLEAADFAVDEHLFRLPEDYQQENTDRIYRDWIVLGHLGREPTTAGLRAEPQHFTLEQIEGDQIRSYPEPAAVAWWVQFDFPGNPYGASRAGKRRALSIAIVDMMMLESAQRDDPRNLKPDFMAANLGTWAYTFHHCHQLLPAEAEEAYRQGMLHYLTKMERLAPRDGNTNMDMREIATLAELNQVWNDDVMHRRLVDDARRILFGDVDRDASTSDPRRGTFHPAGYIGEADGPETSYNGISLYHLAEAAMITRGDPEWDAFLPEVIHRMVRFKAYNTFPEPDGSYEGPSSWSKRTNAPYPRDQRDRPWRAFAEAMLTPEALYRLRLGPESQGDRRRGLASREEMLAQIAQGIDRLNRHPKRPEKWKAAEPPVWQERHWPEDLPYTWDHYVPGTYARLQELSGSGEPMLVAPLERVDDFSKNFDGEFWIARRGQWAFQVEAVPHMGRAYDAGGSGALAGGSLATFWTAATGVVVLGRLPDKWNYVTWDKIEQWPTHHLWGRVEEGPAFSSARQRDPWVHFETGREPPQVHILGGLGMDRTTEQPDILDVGHVYYRRQFTMQQEGLHIRSEILSRGTDSVTELWETLPIYVNDAQQSKGDDAITEVRRGGSWQPASVDPVEETEAIRVQRFGGAVQIEFDQPQRVKLSEVIVTDYQKKDRLRNVQIDLLRTNGRAAAMPKRAAVDYLIKPAP